MEDHILGLRGRLRYHLREIMDDDQMLAILFAEMHRSVESAETGPEIIAAFRERMTNTAVQYMAKRYEAGLPA